MITLDIISDPVCPWCYIGKTHFDRAVESRGVQPFDIHWRPFQLNPDMPAAGMDRRAYLEQKFGPDGAKKSYARIEEHAKAAGLELRFDLIKRTPNTFDAHRLIRWARTSGAQTPLVERLFASYFERGEDIGDRDLLLDIAESVGMERAVVKELFDRDADREALQTEEATVREIGVNSVPTFVVAGKHVVSGAQPPELWERVLDELTGAPAAG
ncbi:DsbA family oxidoreductase [Pikeienuella sp. HZG-20]|uniref:DsbA family oxidoreductase n=1 Tax=Paludibacillus litoralis TaxID=3133267 RepID=UPI0030ECBADB